RARGGAGARDPARGGRGVRRAAPAAAAVALPIVAFPILAILALRWLPPPTSAFMLEADRPVRHRWAPWGEIPPQLAVAVSASEDQKLPWPHGFDFDSISSALSGQEVRRLSGPRGASTITQQVAKNLFLWPGKSFLRKGLEAWLTLWIEALWPKRRIL